MDIEQLNKILQSAFGSKFHSSIYKRPDYRDAYEVNVVCREIIELDLAPAHELSNQLVRKLAKLEQELLMNTDTGFRLNKKIKELEAKVKELEKYESFYNMTKGLNK